jgi:hypothetical protein
MSTKPSWRPPVPSCVTQIFHQWNICVTQPTAEGTHDAVRVATEERSALAGVPTVKRLGYPEL